MGLSLKNISKSYGSINVLNSLHLEVKDGEFISLVGPSGSGKTTLLRIIAGFLKVDQGEVILNKKDISNISAKNRGISMVFQNYALFPNLNVYENIAFGMKAAKKSSVQINEVTSKLIKMVEIKGLEKKYPKQLSGGQQQRVALARALAISPEILLLDEPLSALDAKVRLNLRYELRRIQEQTGITALYVTHDQEEALSISDRVAVLNKGTIEQVASPQEIYNKPANLFVADFIGISNVLTVEMLSAEKGLVKWYDYDIKTVSYDKKINYLIIRPEKIRLEKDIDKNNLKYDNFLEGVVQGQVFLGSVLRLAVIVKKKRFIVDLNHSSISLYQRNERVYLLFNREDTRLLVN
ncbi:MAG: ABC transporter ATP-binding protein [Firmicutes bacterium]|nr:ABC transporter ATP-binding protein [Bacillota bacterium]